MDTCSWVRGPTIGRGSFATVSIAATGDQVLAVKSVMAERSSLLKREQGILSRLESPTVVGYMGESITNEGNQHFYNVFMEYVEGGTLTASVKSRGRLEEKDIIGYTREILKGIAYIHSRKLVHCDIKGQNILIGRDGPKIADFGCAKWGDETDRPIAGTPAYMAPEVARGDEQSYPADIWALGCTVIEMATGRGPWATIEDPILALYRTAYSDEHPQLPCSLSSTALDFLRKCFARNPTERMTANQLLQHPLLDESTSCCQANAIPKNSPTSILDQWFWNSQSEPRIEVRVAHIHTQSALERIRRLSGVNWPDWGGAEKWTTVRKHGASTDSCEPIE